MRLLVDTCTFLWMGADPASLSATARTAVAGRENDVLVSAASAFEIAVKFGLGSLTLPAPPEVWLPRTRAALGVGALDIVELAALRVAGLPHLHRDPFDRLLVAQALVHDLVLVTPDTLIRQYDVRTLW